MGKELKSYRKLRMLNNVKTHMEKNNAYLTLAAKRKMEASQGSQFGGPVTWQGWQVQATLSWGMGRVMFSR